MCYVIEWNNVLIVLLHIWWLNKSNIPQRWYGQVKDETSFGQSKSKVRRRTLMPEVCANPHYHFSHRDILIRLTDKHIKFIITCNPTQQVTQVRGGESILWSYRPDSEYSLAYSLTHSLTHSLYPFLMINVMIICYYHFSGYVKNVIINPLLCLQIDIPKWQ